MVYDTEYLANHSVDFDSKDNYYQSALESKLWLTYDFKLKSVRHYCHLLSYDKINVMTIIYFSKLKRNAAK